MAGLPPKSMDTSGVHNGLRTTVRICPEGDESLTKVLTVEGPHGPQKFPLPTSGTVLIGRDPKADIRLADAMTSRSHVRVHVNGDLVEVEDLGSANGTRVRGEPLGPRARIRLSVGDWLTIGTTRLALELVRGTGTARVFALHSPFLAYLRAICRAHTGTLALARLNLSGDTSDSR
jgi:hypothetical protein